MKKSKRSEKNILIWSDDFQEDFFHSTLKKLVEPGAIYFNDKDNRLKFNLTLTRTLDNIDLDSFDAVLIDYGLIGGETDKETLHNINLIKSIKVPIAWCGGMPKSYNEDSKKMFPDYTRLHNLHSCSTESQEILLLLYKILEEGENIMKKTNKVAKWTEKEKEEVMHELAHDDIEKRLKRLERLVPDPDDLR